MLRNYETTRKLFDDWAKTYEEDVRKSEGPLFGYDHSLMEASQMIVTDEKSKILDLGIGTGALASLVSKNDELAKQVLPISSGGKLLPTTGSSPHISNRIFSLLTD